jgi:RNA polymerase-binding transcription factor DksA
MPTPFAPTSLDELARRLVRRRASIEQIATTSRRDASSAIEELAVSDVSDFLDSDGPDAGTNEVDRGRALALAALAAANLEAIDQALARVGAGTYGTCDGCDTRIPLARLRALPETTVCVECKRTGSQLLALAG